MHAAMLRRRKVVDDGDVHQVGLLGVRNRESDMVIPEQQIAGFGASLMFSLPELVAHVTARVVPVSDVIAKVLNGDVANVDEVFSVGNCRIREIRRAEPDFAVDRIFKSFRVEDDSMLALAAGHVTFHCDARSLEPEPITLMTEVLDVLAKDRFTFA